MTESEESPAELYERIQYLCERGEKRKAIECIEAILDVDDGIE